MNSFKNHNTLLMSSQDKYEYLQKMMGSNLSNIILPMYSKGGILCGSKRYENDTSFKVSEVSGKILVSGGVAIAIPPEIKDTNSCVDIQMIFLGADGVAKATSSFTDGRWYVYISTNKNYVASGKEKYSQSSSAVFPDTVKTLEYDGCTVTFVKDDPGLSSYCKFLVAYFDIASGALSGAISGNQAFLGYDEKKNYVDPDDLKIMSYIPLERTPARCVTIGTEQILIGSLVSSGIHQYIYNCTRAQNGTAAQMHYAKDDIIYSGIVDTRMGCMAELRDTVSYSFLKLLQQGVMKFEEAFGYRQIMTRPIYDIPNTPSVNKDDIKVIWLNQHLSDTINQTGVREKIGALSTIQADVDMRMTEISMLKSDFAKEADPVVKAQIGLQINSSQRELIKLKAESSVNMQGLSSIIPTVDKKYVCEAIITPGAEIDGEDIVYYIAEVIYLPYEKAVINNYKTNVVNTKKRTVNNINKYGDYEYEAVTAEHNMLVFPIQPDECARFRVAAVNAAGMKSDWTEYIEYKFDSKAIGNASVALATQIDNLIKNNPLYDSAITSEQLQYILASMEKITTLENIIAEQGNALATLTNKYGSIENAISSLRNRVAILEGKLSIMSSTPINNTQEYTT